MTKSEIADKIRESCSLEKKEILYVIDQFLDSVLESVDRNERVEIRGFGTFFRETRKALSVYSPISQKIVDVPERSIVAFRPSKQTMKAHNEGA